MDAADLAFFVQQLINGLTLGGIYGLIAIGYTMVYGIIGMINFAHGDVFMIGAFTALITFLVMGLIGVIIAMVVNIFLQSSAMQFVISVVGVLVFVGLTAYDTQRIKESYSIHMSGEMATKSAIHGALRLYLDFINLFIMLLHLFGNNR